MDRREKIYIAGVAPDCRAQALRWGLGVESDLFCTAANLEDPESIRLEAALVQGIPRRIVHGPFNELCPAAIDPMVRQVTRLRYEQALAMARRMGTGRLVLHSGYIPLIYFPEWFIEQSAAFWQEFLQDKPADTELLLENVLEDDPGLTLDIVRRVDDPRLRLCLDVGHANCQTKEHSVEDWVRQWAPFLGHTHLHNNDGSWDTHSPLGEGTVPMEHILELLAELAPRATWTLEARTAEESCRWLAERHWIGEEI